MFEVELRREKALFAATDAAAILVGLIAAGVVNDLRGTPPCVLCRANTLHTMLTGLALMALWFVAGKALHLYELYPGDWRHFVRVIKTAVVATVVALTISFALHGEPPRLLAASVLLFSVGAIVAARGSVTWVLGRFQMHPNFGAPIVILGFNSLGQYLCDQIDSAFKHCKVLGFLDPDLAVGNHRGRFILGGLDEIPRLARIHANLEVAIVLPDSSADLTDSIVALCERNRVRWRLMPALVRSLPTGLRVDNVGVIPLIGPRSSNIQGVNFVLKRACDIAITTLVFVITAPIMLAAAAAILLFDGSPVLFRQTRIGLYGKPFKLLKFRTMHAVSSEATHQAYVREWIQNGTNGAAQNGGAKSKVYKMTADSRITPVGRVLRRFSIDELPQLINVLRGEMSLIGPRPALAYELDLYQDWHCSRLAALPGITGLWQVSGRNTLSFEEMVRLDIRYIEGWSLAEDLRIIVRTIPALFNGGGH